MRNGPQQLRRVETQGGGKLLQAVITNSHERRTRASGRGRAARPLDRFSCAVLFFPPPPSSPLLPLGHGLRRDVVGPAAHTQLAPRCLLAVRAARQTKERAPPRSTPTRWKLITHQKKPSGVQGPTQAFLTYSNENEGPGRRRCFIARVFVDGED